ncbi:MAG: hypothetical protein GXY74_01130 [Phycisphaerae bacterium]|nr:hypothetical protein [Phycisphaerae bacterium]
MDYSQLAFPAYRFILPEVLADDWLATVGWHKLNRDHVLHQPLTAYVVLKLLTGGEHADPPFMVDDKTSLLDACVDEILKWQGTAYLRESLFHIGIREGDPWLENSPVGRALWRCLFVEAAYLAAIFHDMGYPWQYVNLLSNKLEHAGLQPDSPGAGAEQLLEAFGDRLLFCPLNGYRVLNRTVPATWGQQLAATTAKALRKTHGLPGAIGFLYLNDILRDYPVDDTHPIRQFCVEWAAMAILMHDMPKIYWGDGTTLPSNGHMRLKFSVDPLSCVVALADVVEDFARPVARFQDLEDVAPPAARPRDAKEAVALTYRDSCDTTVLTLHHASSPAVLTIDYRFSQEDQCAVKRHWIPKEHRDYFDRQHGYLDLSGMGVDRVDMLASRAAV